MWFIVVVCAAGERAALSAPMAELERAMTARESAPPPRASWQDLVPKFRDARRAAGSHFTRDVLQVVGDSEERAYQIAWFLLEESFLEGDPADPRLALRVADQGLAANDARRRAASSVDYQRMTVPPRVSLLYAATMSALDARQAGRAARYKGELICWLEAEEWAVAGMPAVDEADRTRFEDLVPRMVRCPTYPF